MRRKFSIDKRRRVMIPNRALGEHWERAEISWGQRFYMTEYELYVISQDAIDSYERLAPQLYQW